MKRTIAKIIGSMEKTLKIKINEIEESFEDD